MGNSAGRKYTNRLIHESSPYLLQHAHNPVNWYPWGEEALDKARLENKPIIVSIGYAACHWCHVMEHESFENEEVAGYMNEYFVSIKVDREERPDIDQVYMNAVQLIDGRGGWPLNCIALADGRPVFGGTYFTSHQWLHVLSQVLEFMRAHPERAEQQAMTLTEGVQSSELITMNTDPPEFSVQDLEQVFAGWKDRLDYVEGGYKGAPKFPLPVGFRFLLDFHFLTRNSDALKALELTLRKMADGGIYDQVGGGFARYSVDERWMVPHFEKMLYDNAQLASLYSFAYQHSRDPSYRRIAEETLGFVKRELHAAGGGFYSSLDADSEGEEGRFYVWTRHELQEVLGREESGWILDYYNVKEDGNWENGQNILHIREEEEVLARRYNLSPGEMVRQLTDTKSRLLKERGKRVSPGLDDKLITAWNAMMMKACLDAYRVFDKAEYLEMALQTATFINTELRQSDHRLLRNYKNGRASINAFLDDYAFTISAFIALYQSSFEEEYLEQARRFCDYATAHFYDSERAMFYYTSDLDPPLIARKMEVSDNVIPASNSEMAKNLFILGHYFYSEDYIDMARRMLNNVKQNALTAGPYYANWDILMAWFAGPPFEVVILGDQSERIRKEFNDYYLPNVLVSGGKEEGSLSLLKGKLIGGQTTIYVCRDKTCRLPVTEVKDALKQIMD